MNFKPLFSIVVFTILVQFSFAQSAFYIDGDTIGVSKDFKTFITFPDTIRSWDFARKGDYSAVKKQLGKKCQLSISTISDDPPAIWSLLVTEGDKDNPRQHRFVIAIQDPSAFTAEKAIYDYSDLTTMLENKKDADKIKRSRKNSSTAHTPSVPKAENPATTSSEASSIQSNNGLQQSNGSNQPDLVIDGQVIKRSEINAQVVTLINRFKNLVQGLANHNLSAQQGLNASMKQIFNYHNDIIVQVRNSSGVQSRTLEAYLTALTRLPYKKVTLEFGELQYLTDFHKNPDGSYSAIVKISQKFVGEPKSGEQPKYVDITEKTFTINVVVESTTDSDGVVVKKVKVYLGNISVAEAGK